MAKKTLNLGENFNPAMQFISNPTEEKEHTGVQSAQSIPEGYKLNPLYIETRSKRLQLLIQPSLYEKIKARADREKSSINDTIHKILEKALREE